MAVSLDQLKGEAKTLSDQLVAANLYDQAARVLGTFGQLGHVHKAMDDAIRMGKEALAAQQQPTP